MTIKERIEAVLKKEMPDQVPFTIYWLMLPRGAKERQLRNKGLGISWRTDVIRWEYPNCEVDKKTYKKDSRLYQQEIWSTPVGKVYQTTTS